MKNDSKIKENKKNLLIYGSEIIIPLTLTIAGVSTIAICNLPLMEEIVLGGGTFITGFQTISGTGHFYKDFKKSFQELKKEKQKVKHLKYCKTKEKIK